MNRIQIETAIARHLGDLLVPNGSLLAAQTTSLLKSGDVVFSEVNQLRGRQLYLHTSGLSGVPEAVAFIASYSFATGAGQLGLIPTLAATGTQSDLFNVYDKFLHSDYVEAIDDAMRRARQVYLIDKIATLGLVATQWEYNLPSGFDYVSGLRFVPSGSTDFDEDNAYSIPRQAFEIKANPNGTYVISFDPRFIDLTLHDAELVQVTGQRRPSTLSVGTSVSEVSESFVIMHAAALLAQRRLQEHDTWLPRFQHFTNESRLELQRLHRQRRASSIEVKQ